jgi:predicted hydrolase (HD superfamily)
MRPNREQAEALLRKYVKTESQIIHAKSVESAMRFFAGIYGEDKEFWGICGLLHDIDYDLFPEQHCIKAKDILESEDIDSDIIHAVQSHGYGICCDIEPMNLMEKTLFAVDELTGLISATAIMRPSRSVMDLETKSVKKKFKDKRFAAKIDRSTIERGAEMMGISLDELIENTILGMREVHEELNL